jgi:hypothetical protein
MSQTLTISDALYQKLEAEARKQGLNSVEHFIEARLLPPRQLLIEQDPFARTVALQERLSRTYGEMPDSAGLVREDRER